MQLVGLYIQKVYLHAHRSVVENSLHMDRVSSQKIEISVHDSGENKMKIPIT